MVGRFMLRRDNKVLRSHLPAKVEFVVFVKLQPLQEELCASFLKSKAIAKLKKGGKDASLVSITTLTKLCNHPSLIYDSCKRKECSPQITTTSFPKEILGKHPRASIQWENAPRNKTLNFD
eukprot:UN11012